MLMLGWTGRIRTCECWDQNPVPYRLATVQSAIYFTTRKRPGASPGQFSAGITITYEQRGRREVESLSIVP